MSRPVAAVTGASAGIGKVFCHRLAARGYDLVVIARDGARLDALGRELAERHGTKVEAVSADLAREEEMVRVGRRLADTPGLTLLVNNAGFGSVGPLATIDPERQADMVRLHALAATRLSQAVLPGFVARRNGGIINVSSVASFLYSAGNANYCATKAYLRVFSEGLAAEVRGAGVRVQALCPGFTHTEFHQRMRIETGGIPGWMWLDADFVVEDSLRSLERGGPVVCVPGMRYKLLVALIAVVPRGLLRRLGGLRGGR